MPPILPINREDGGQTQLQNEQNGAVSAVPQPTYPAINIPDVITPDFFNRPPSADRQRIENDLQTRRQEYMTSFQQTQREQQLQQETLDLETQLTNLRQSEAKGQFNIEQQRIAMPLITGQQAALQRQAQLERGDVLSQLESKQRSLGFEVAKREGIMAKAKAAIGFAESDLDRIDKLEQNQFEREKAVLDYAQKLGDSARQTLGTILSNFKGMGWNDLSEQARTGLANLAAQAGIDPYIIAQGLETQKDSQMVKQEKDRLEMEKLKKELSLPSKLDTSITEANGRRLLVNDQTGEVIKDLGVSELPKDGIAGGMVSGVATRDADSVMAGTLNLQDISQKDNYRAGVASILTKKFQEALKTGDIYGAMRASAVYDKEPGDAFLTSMEKTIAVLSQIGVLQQNIEGQNTGPLVGAFREKNPWDIKAQTIKAQLNAIVPNLARGVYGEVGVLTDNDIKQYSKTLPTLTSTEAIRNAILYITVDQIRKNVEIKIKNQAAGQRDMSGYADVYTNLTQEANNILKSIPGGGQQDLSSLSNQEFLQSIPTFGPPTPTQTNNKSFFGGIYNWLTGK